MRILRLAAMLVGLVGAAIGLSAQKASATPLAGSLPAATVGGNALVSDVRYYRRYYRPRRAFYRAYYRPRRAYYRRYYRPRRAFYYPRAYRPRVVCRIRYGYYGPRRVCFRRF